MKTSEEITYDRLKTLIVNNKLPFGIFLSQRKLAESVGATLSTLRSCLRLLENDGLIENVPKWGVRIPVENDDSMKERYYVRELLEVGAVDKILERNDPKARAILEKKAVACDAIRLSNPESFKEFARIHTDFHMEIARLCGNKFLCQELSRLNFRSMMLSNSKYGWEMHGENINEAYHQDYIWNIFESDRQSALEAVRTHIRRGCVVELDTLRKISLKTNETVQAHQY